jgi:NADPH-dependent curcumin reductase CurA
VLRNLDVRSRQIVLRARPTGTPSAENFGLETIDVPEPAEGEIQVRNTWMSVDPYMRRRMFDDPGYTSAFGLGQPLDGSAIGEVTASNDPRVAVGTIVLSAFGWRERFNTTRSKLKQVQLNGLPPEVFLAEAGTTGLAAYVGLLRIANLVANETVFVSAAAGAVGLVACQISLARGCTVIASAGGEMKCDYLKSLGVQHTIDYQSTANLTDALKSAAGEGIDVYFDNVGGDHLQAALEAARPFARFVLCGMISQGSGRVAPTSPPPSNLLLAVTKRLRLQGFIVGDHADEADAFMQEMSEWIAAGKIKPKCTVRTGLANAPAALIDLFRGANIGKMLVKI